VAGSQGTVLEKERVTFPVALLSGIKGKKLGCKIITGNFLQFIAICYCKSNHILTILLVSAAHLLMHKPYIYSRPISIAVNLPSCL